MRLFGSKSKAPEAPDAPVADIGKYLYEGPAPEDLEARSDLERLFWDKDGPVVHKWHHYLPLYERYFGPFRGRPVRMLEIGVSLGGSLDMWRAYLGPDAVLYGVDIDPSCARFDGISGQVRIGSQDDAGFLADVVAEMGGIDLVLDDGSHDSRHIRASLEVLYPKLSDGGIYMIEDLHAAYWSDFSGGYQVPGSFMSDVKQMIDDLHHWYHRQGEKQAATAGHLAGIHVHDSIVVLEKARVLPPRHSLRGRDAAKG